MAETYPLNLENLKRSIDLAEQMNVDTDMSGQTVEQRLVTLKAAILLAQTIYNNGIEGNKDEFNKLIDRVVLIGNDLNDKLEALDIATGGDANVLADQITALKMLLEGDAGVTIINTLDKLADETNARTATLVFPVTINDNTGKGVVDITALGLATTTDFNATVTQNATANFVFVNYAVKKVDSNTLEVVAYDARYTPETAPLYDGTATPANFMVSVHYLRPAISITLTETDGDTAQVGN